MSAVCTQNIPQHPSITSHPPDRRRIAFVGFFGSIGPGLRMASWQALNPGLLNLDISPFPNGVIVSMDSALRTEYTPTIRSTYVPVFEMSP